MKRTKNGCVVLAMAAGIALALPRVAQADTETVNGIEWTYQIVDGEAWLNNDGYAVIPPETVGDITIPSTLGGCPVTTIWDRAFDNCESLTGVTIPDGVTTIGRYAFEGCSSLERLTILGSAVEIWPLALRGCLKLADADGFVIFRNTLYDYCGDAEEVTIPNGVTEIAGYSFYWCDSIKKVTIPDSVTKIGTCAFESCHSLEDVQIPDSVTSIGECAFRDDPLLADENGLVIVRGTVYDYYGKSSALTIPSGVTVISYFAFLCDAGKLLNSVTLPSGLIKIEGMAFEDCGELKRVNIPSTVNTMDGGAFYGTALETVYVEEGDTERVRRMIEESGFDTGNITFVEGAMPGEEFTVTFDADGGTVTPATLKVANGAEIGELPVATRAKYKFLGWYTEKKGGTAVTAETVVEADATVYAHWVSAWKVTFNANGGQIGGSKTAAVMVQKGKAVGMLQKATRTGYTFKGWYTKKSGGSKISTKTKIKKNITYYAQWTAKKYTVKLTKTGSGKTSGGGKKAYKSKITLKATASKGWKFAGWYLGDTLKSKKATWKTIVPLNGATYTAKFVKK